MNILAEAMLGLWFFYFINIHWCQTLMLKTYGHMDGLFWELSNLHAVFSKEHILWISFRIPHLFIIITNGHRVHNTYFLLSVNFSGIVFGGPSRAYPFEMKKICGYFWKELLETRVLPTQKNHRIDWSINHRKVERRRWHQCPFLFALSLFRCTNDILW